MTAPPFCTTCGSHHHPRRSHQFNTKLASPVPPAGNPRMANIAVVDVANADDVANNMANASSIEPGRNRASTTYRYRHPDRRRAYQRDLMRRRRATGKAA